MTATLTLSIPHEWWLSANIRRHWADEAKRTRALRQYANIQARYARLGHFDVVHVAAFIGYPTAGRADPSNSAPTVKACLDGLTDAGIWDDDDSTHVIGPTYLRDPKSAVPKHHTVRLVITPQEIPW